METILVLLHAEPDGSLRKASLEALEAARALNGNLICGLLGGTPSIAGCGATRVLAIEGEAFSHPRYSTDAAAAAAFVQATNPSIVIAPATSRWSRVMAGVAQRTGGRIDTHITAIAATNGAIEVTRWFYRQRIEATLSSAHRPWFLLLEGGVAAPFEPSGEAPAIETLTCDASSRTQVTGIVSPQSGEQTIRPEAALLFVTGAGWTKKQKDGAVHIDRAAQLILGFLHKTEASLGSSKSLVDLSGEGHAVLPFLSHLNQVGQTGATPRHPKGLATCCHGEEPHVVGWRFVPERRAINLDAGCGWARGKADVLYVADAFEVIARLNELLSS